MKSVRVVLAVVALLALPFGAVAAQGRAKPKPRTASETSSECKDQQAATLSRANDAGHDPYGLDKKCDPVPPPPDPSAPPTGMHEAVGIVYEDLDGSGRWGMFDDLPFQGWTIELYWDGRLVSTTTSGQDGRYVFSGLGDSNKLWWVCVIPQPGYVRTQPADGDPRAVCNGNGLAHTLNNPQFMTQLLTDFGFMLP